LLFAEILPEKAA